MAIDTEAVKEHIRGLLRAIGEDPNREGLRDTPERVARMYEEIFEGTLYSNEQIAAMFDKTFSDDLDLNSSSRDPVVVRDIRLFSYCEHHMALMYDMTAVCAYIPNGKIIGLSKIARIADMVCKRLQVQERIGADIAHIMRLATGSEDVGVRISAAHSCMTSRGIRSADAKTITTTLRGRFLSEPELLRLL